MALKSKDGFQEVRPDLGLVEKKAIDKILNAVRESRVNCAVPQP